MSFHHQATQHISSFELLLCFAPCSDCGIIFCFFHFPFHQELPIDRFKKRGQTLCLWKWLLLLLQSDGVFLSPNADKITTIAAPATPPVASSLWSLSTACCCQGLFFFDGLRRTKASWEYLRCKLITLNGLHFSAWNLSSPAALAGLLGFSTGILLAGLLTLWL